MGSVLIRPRIKICGFTRSQDVDAAVRAGVDAVGFVFAKGSKRELNKHQAAELCRSVPAFVSRVGLFLDQDADLVRQTLQQVPLSLLQFHGRENGDFCRQFDLPYIKAVAMSSADDLKVAESEYGDAAGLLLDSHEAGGMGGTGTRFDWSLVSQGALPLILAGGLTVENVTRAIQLLKPWAVDVSSGVESAPGIKDATAIRCFIEEVRREH